MAFYFILVISLLILTPSASTAQNDYLIFSQLSIDEGLSQSIVSCIIQDHQGFMWFGTEDGLNRYDGYDIKIIRQHF